MRKQLRSVVLTLIAASLCLGLLAQPSNHPINGVRDVRQGKFLLTGVSLHVDAKTVIEAASVLIDNGKIVSAGASISKPADAVVYDMKGKHLYPAFIDLWTSVGMPEPKPVSPREFFSQGPQYESNRPGPYTWNQAIKPEVKAAASFNGTDGSEWRKQGFAAVLTHQPDGIVRGTGALVLLADRKSNEDVLVADAGAFYSFNKGSSTQQYPSSLMGSIALLRQTFLDAQWYASGAAEQTDLGLEALNKSASLPQFFLAGDKQNLFRVAKIGQEFSKNFIMLGAGDEYQRIDDIKALNARLLVPLNFPQAYRIDDPDQAQELPLEMMKHWELAPFNLARLEKAGIPFCLTTADPKTKADFLKNLRKAVKYGLSKEKALEALTILPARWIKQDNQLGAVKAGYIANLIVTDGDLFDDRTRLLETWSAGQRFVNEVVASADLRAKYSLSGHETVNKLQLTLSGKPETLKATLSRDSTKLPATLNVKWPEFTLAFSPNSKKPADVVYLQGYELNGRLEGTGQDLSGKEFTWTATRTEMLPDTASAPKADSITQPGPVTYPFMAFGRQSLPKPQNWLFRNATVWTSDAQGKLEATDVRVENGKITAIGKNLPTANATVVDATGKHLTAGLIDEHSHIAVSGSVNEGTQSVSAEVRIGDVVDMEDINMYRQLSGGVIGAQLLHGSANCIGGQSALIKHKWGATADQIKIAGADGFIKFALGENVKQTNWGERYTIRFPQTRMGVEQIMVDAFTRAKAYQEAHKKWALTKEGPQPRKDLEEEALVEIMNSQRFVTCHSYIQSEINMLMKTAERFGFRINTFTHILEGYKVADKMKLHGAGASTFSDWWAYKMEVMDAIPFNPTMLMRHGLVTAINSDDAEMGRRLNQEAAKLVKYGNLSEEEALKTVTINPAKLLHLDKRTGSIAVGKDADLVLWSDNPLSVYAKVEKTLIEGAAYYDQTEDEQLRASVAAERQRLIGKLMAEKLKGNATQPARVQRKKMKHCEDLGEGVFEFDQHDHQQAQTQE